MNSRTPPRITLTLRSFLILLVVQALVILLLVWPGHNSPQNSAAGRTGLPSETPSPTSTDQPSQTPSPAPTLPPPDPTATNWPTPLASSAASGDGWIVLSLNDNGYAHLFAYQPQTLPLTRLTDHPWDDMDPALSPDGSRVAYRSRQNGYWDLYLLDLRTGQQTRLTDTPAYDGSPSWSPDGSWIVYETYLDNNLELIIRPVDDPGAEPIRLTNDPASDFSPAWSPSGRRIAFISTRAGENDVWLADLDNVDNRFTALTNTSQQGEDHPAWSPDGNHLAWSAREAGGQAVFRLDLTAGGQTEPVRVCSGEDPAWSPSGDLLLTGQMEPNQAYLAIYAGQGQTLWLPPVALPGSLHGMNWSAGSLPTDLAQVFSAAQTPPAPLWQAQLTPVTEGPRDRVRVVPLAGVTAPYAYLSDQVDEAFTALRARLGQETGWDLLSSLENAYVPLTGSLSPGMEEDWLYTGRAITFSSAPVGAGWMVVVPEDFAGQTYWRVYLKARYQDGSQGMPLEEKPWDINARGNGDPLVYEAGGQWSASVPTGYWIDLTDLAARYGWYRAPALVNWRSYYQGARFNELVAYGGQDWQSALLELYPPEIFATPTAGQPALQSPTPLPTWYKTRVPTQTVTPSITPSLRPTWTPPATQP